jgi:hypothetical protein
MLCGVPKPVKAFFRPVVRDLSKPLRRALPLMVLALLVAPHRRCLKTLAGMVLGHREHVATLSRRLRNRLWKTLQWYTALFQELRAETDRWEGGLAGAQQRHWRLVIDTDLSRDDVGVHGEPTLLQPASQPTATEQQQPCLPHGLAVDGQRRALALAP